MGFVDIDFAGCEDARKSTTGWVFTLAGGPVSEYGMRRGLGGPQVTLVMDFNFASILSAGTLSSRDTTSSRRSPNSAQNRQLQTTYFPPVLFATPAPN